MDKNPFFRPQNNEGWRIVIKYLRVWLSAQDSHHSPNCALDPFGALFFFQMTLFRAVAAARCCSYRPTTHHHLKRMRIFFFLLLRGQPQLRVMDYSFWFGRGADYGTRGWVSNSLLGFRAFLKCGFKNTSLTVDESKNSGSKLHLTSGSQILSGPSPCKRTQVQERENELDWCCREEDVACGWRSSRLTACGSF